MAANRLAGGDQRRKRLPGIYEAITGSLGAILLGVCISLSACVLVNSSSIGEKTGGGTPVSTEYSDYGILHLTAPWTLTSSANAALASQCQSGVLSNVQTELATRDWFFIVQYYTVTVNAVCK